MTVTANELEQQLAGAKRIAELGDIAIKLNSNRDFRKLILEEFCVNECARYAQESADPALTPMQRADALAMAQAAGHLRRFLSITILKANTADSQISQIEEAIEEVRAEEEGASA